MKTTKSDNANCTQEDIQSLNNDIQYVSTAQDSLLRKLFNFVPERPGDYSIERKIYIKAMLEVQQEFQLQEGDPMLVLFVLEQLSRSPKIINSFDSSKKCKNNTKR